MVPTYAAASAAYGEGFGSGVFSLRRYAPVVPQMNTTCERVGESVVPAQATPELDRAKCRSLVPVSLLFRIPDSPQPCIKSEAHLSLRCDFCFFEQLKTDNKKRPANTEGSMRTIETNE